MLKLQRVAHIKVLPSSLDLYSAAGVSASSVVEGNVEPTNLDII